MTGNVSVGLFVVEDDSKSKTMPSTSTPEFDIFLYFVKVTIAARTRKIANANNISPCIMMARLCFN